MSEKREYLDDAESQALLGCYGIPTVTTVVTGSLIAAKKHAAKMGYPLAVKGTSAGLVHRSELKAIYLDVGSEREMVSAYQKIDAQLSKRWGKPFRIMMQPMVKPGIDLTIGAMNHPGYDPILMFGLGGAFAESTEAVDFKLVPLTDLDARELVEGSIAYPVMKGGRGTAAVDADGLTEIILRFSRLIETHREIIAADLNPLRAFPGKRFVVIDQYFRLAR
jgi:acyl-CoA synthetase (NDP forming)